MISAHKISDTEPNIHFIDSIDGKEHITNDFSGKHKKFYGVDMACTPVLQIKHVLILGSLILFLDALIKGLYKQIE